MRARYSASIFEFVRVAGIVLISTGYEPPDHIAPIELMACLPYEVYSDHLELLNIGKDVIDRIELSVVLSERP